MFSNLFNQRQCAFVPIHSVKFHANVSWKSIPGVTWYVILVRRTELKKMADCWKATGITWQKYTMQITLTGSFFKMLNGNKLRTSELLQHFLISVRTKFNIPVSEFMIRIQKHNKWRQKKRISIVMQIRLWKLLEQFDLPLAIHLF